MGAYTSDHAAVVRSTILATELARKLGRPVQLPAPYKARTSAMGVIPLGPNGGAGYAFGMTIPEFAVVALKSRDLFLGALLPKLGFKKQVKIPASKRPEKQQSSLLYIFAAVGIACVGVAAYVYSSKD